MIADWKRAVVSGDIDAVRRLLASGTDVDALDRYGQTALMLVKDQVAENAQSFQSFWLAGGPPFAASRIMSDHSRLGQGG